MTVIASLALLPFLLFTFMGVNTQDPFWVNSTHAVHQKHQSTPIFLVNMKKKYIYMYIHNYNSRIIIYPRLTTSGKAYETEKLRDLHHATNVRHLSIDSCKLAYYCLKLAVRDRGDKPNSTVRLSAAASLPTIPPWGHTTNGEYIFTTHREPKKSHQAKQSRILDGASPLVYRRLLSRVWRGKVNAITGIYRSSSWDWR